MAVRTVRTMGPSSETVARMQGLGEWISLGLALLGAVAIVYGTVACLALMVRAKERRARATSAAARLELARYLALALEFQLAADVIETSLSPDWTKIGRLAAIGAIRTALNYFLGRDMNEDRSLVREHDQAGQASGDVNSR